MAFNVKKLGGGKLKQFEIKGIGGEPREKKSMQQQMGEQVKALETGFAKRRAEESQRFEDATDSEYWFCVCFQSRAQREAFLKATGLTPKTGDPQYLDGEVVAEKLGVTLPKGPSWDRKFRSSRDYIDMALDD